MHTWSRGNGNITLCNERMTLCYILKMKLSSDTIINSDKSTLDDLQIDGFSDIAGVDIQPVQECYQGELLEA